MKKNKYVHILWQGGVHFNKIIVELINNENNAFNINEHLFVTPYEHFFNEICSFPNVVLERDVKPQSAEMINKYANFGEWIFLHGMCSTAEAFKIKYKNQKKIIWRTWGHDLGGFPYKKGDVLKNLVKYLLNLLWKNEVHNFRLLGIANAVDKISLENRFGNVKTFPIDYPTKNNLEMLNSLKAEMTTERKTINILIGHSGIESDNHFEIIDKLRKFYNDDVCFIFVLSYGDERYICKVKEYIEINCNGKYKLLLNSLPLVEYAKVLSEIDVAILDGKMSYALSNVAMLLFFEKKIFLNRDGILAQAFRAENIPFCCTDEIDHMNIEDFSVKLDYSNVMETSLMPTEYEEAVKRWKIMLASLDK